MPSAECGIQVFHSAFRIPHSPFVWRAWGDLNTRHTAPEAVALSGLSYRRIFSIAECGIRIAEWEDPSLVRYSAIRIPKSANSMVGARGFEPPTPCSQSRCATGLRHAPIPSRPFGPRPDQKSDCGRCGTTLPHPCGMRYFASPQDSGLLRRGGRHTPRRRRFPAPKIPPGTGARAPRFRPPSAWA